MSKQQKDFLESYKNAELSNYFALKPGNFEAALKLDRQVDRKALVNALHTNAKRLAAPKAVFEAIDRLAKSNSKAVLTGQQAGLLIGPNYSISKAISAIRLAQKLSSNTENVVPIFWVASQDHDAEEANHAYLLDFKENLHKLALDLPIDVPMGRIAIAKDWPKQILEQITELGYQAPFLDEAKNLINKTADLANNYADWFIAMLYQLLGPYGLIIIDPMQAEIAELSKPLIEHELNNPLASSKLINEAADTLKDAAFKPQIGRAEGASNLFLEENSKRQLLKYNARGFYTANQKYSKEDLLEILANDPAAITPAAGLRPINQDYILPTIVTVVGPGELAYFSQLKRVYELHNVAMPLIQPRLTVTVLEPPVARIMEKYSLDLSDIANLEKVKDKKLLELSGYQEIFDDNLSDLEQSFENMMKQIRKLDPTLLKTVCKAEIHMQKTYDILKRKSARALLNKNEVYHNQFERLEKHLLPLATPQERLISPFSLFLKFGAQNVIRALMELPFEGDHKIKL